MAWFLVALAGASSFVGLWFPGWLLSWEAMLVAYPAYLIALGILAVSRPAGRKHGWQIGSRACWPLALAALSEGIIRGEGVLGSLTLPAALIGTMSVWAVIVIVAGVSLYEIIFSRRGGAVSVSSVSEAIFAFLDYWEKLPVEPMALGPGDRVLLVREQSRWDSVYPALFALIPKLFWLGVSGGALAGLVYLWEGMSLLYEGSILTGEITFHWWLIPAVPVLLGGPLGLAAYFVEEWQRRHHRYVFCLRMSAVVRATFTPIGATTYRSDGPTVEIGEIKRSSPGEKPGEENLSFWGRLWDALRLRIRGVQDVHVPSRYLGAADWLHAIEHALGFSTALMDVVSQAKAFKERKVAWERAYHERSVGDALAGSGWSVVDAVAPRVQEAYERLAGEPGGIINLFKVPDPGLYDFRTGEYLDKAEAGAALGNLADFLAGLPPADED